MSGTFLVIRVAGHNCAIEAAYVEEILHLAATTSLPGQPSVLHGFLNLHGRALPVVSLRSLFGENPVQPDVYSAVIVLRTGADRFAILADRAEEVMEIDPSSLQPVGSQHSFNDCADWIFTVESGRVTVLSPERLLLAKERECISYLQAEVQKRLSDAPGSPE